MRGDKMKMIRIEWHDARFYPGTYTEDACKKHKMCLFKSLGYLITENDTTTIIAGERNDEGEYRDITLIPTGSIVTMRELHEATKPGRPISLMDTESGK